jgi:hypothetical protein
MALLRRLLVVLVVAGAGFVPGPATADGYCSGSGVNVVVDYGALGGGLVKGCDASGNRNAARAFENTRHQLSYAQRQPGFVCRVDGVPASDPCVNTSPADAYWGLYWSDGTSGWKYSSVAAGSLSLPAGATVAFSWQNGGDADLPGTSPAPPPAASQASPTASSPRPTRTPTKAASPTSHATAAGPLSASVTPTPSASGSATTAPSATGTISATATPTPTQTPSDASSPTPSGSPSAASASGSTKGLLDESDDSGGGLPWWLPLGSIAALAGVGGVVWQVRRARS